MLVSLLIATRDSTLGSDLRRLDSGIVVTDIEGGATSLAESGQLLAPDLVVVDRTWIGHDPGTGGFVDAITHLRAADSSPDVVYLAASSESPKARAAAVAGGCVAVLDLEAPRAVLMSAVFALTRRWRDKALPRLDSDTPEPTRFGDFITRSEAMAEVIHVSRRVAPSQSSILILGETGVGKERLARAIHEESPRRNQPFVVVNCGAIPEHLTESELFGHEKGSFTGAHRTHRGHFEMAHGGTILLDEIGELPHHLQVKLLRVLQEREIQRIGAEARLAVDVRVLSATNRDLKAEVAERRFRSDLYYRIGVVTLTIPPLRDRREDIALMLHTNLARIGEQLNTSARRYSDAAIRALQFYDWPGNVREIANVVERAVLLSEDEEIGLEHLPEEIALRDSGREQPPMVSPASGLEDVDPLLVAMPLRQARRTWNDRLEYLYLDALLRDCHGRINETARRAGIDPRSLYDKMRRLGLDKATYKHGNQAADREARGG